MPPNGSAGLKRGGGDIKLKAVPLNTHGRTARKRPRLADENTTTADRPAFRVKHGKIQRIQDDSENDRDVFLLQKSAKSIKSQAKGFIQAPESTTYDTIRADHESKNASEPLIVEDIKDGDENEDYDNDDDSNHTHDGQVAIIDAAISPIRAVSSGVVPVTGVASAASIAGTPTMKLKQLKDLTDEERARAIDINVAINLGSVKPAAWGTNLPKIFKVPPPPKFNPWPFEFPRATEQYDPSVTDCPIDWTQLPALKEVEKQAYEARRGWCSKGKPFQKMADELFARSGDKKSMECMRKRFARANRVVWKATGVYFVSSAKGMDDDVEGYGCPSDSKIDELLKELHAEGRNGHAGHQGGPSKPGKSTVQKEKDTYHPDLVHHGSVITVILLPPGQTRTEQRLVSEGVANKAGVTDGQVLKHSMDTFDHWYNSLCFGLHHTLPKRVYKLWQSPEGLFVYRDNGVPAITIRTLIETYSLSQELKTTEVSDMILDQVLKVLQSEKRFYARYKGRGNICDGDPYDVLRFMDLEPKDIETLWKDTKFCDPINRLVIDLLTFGLNTSEAGVVAALRSPRRASQLYIDFAHRYHAHEIIDAFSAPMFAEQFCADYHNHPEEASCYAWHTPSTRSMQLLDDTTASPSSQSFEIDGVEGCQIPNNTGQSFNIHGHLEQHLEIDRKLVRSYNSWIIFPSTPGPQRREPRPLFIGRDQFDKYGRWPTHPDYGKPDWKKPEEKHHIYEKSWEKEKHENIPKEARKKPTDAQGRVIFETPDREWYPPPSFVAKREHESDETLAEYQQYRREEWVERGNSLPYVTCVRWRPFESLQSAQYTLSNDPLMDRKSQ